MADTQTIGAAVAAILCAGATEAVKSVAGGAAKDAYAALKAKLCEWAGQEVEFAEQKPSSEGRRAALAEAIDARPPLDQAAVKDLASKLAAELSASSGIAGSVGIVFRDLETASLTLKDIEVSGHGNTGAIVERAKSAGAITVEGVKVGPGKPAQ